MGCRAAAVGRGSAGREPGGAAWNDIPRSLVVTAPCNYRLMTFDLEDLRTDRHTQAVGDRGGLS